MNVHLKDSSLEAAGLRCAEGAPGGGIPCMGSVILVRSHVSSLSLIPPPRCVKI